MAKASLLLLVGLAACQDSGLATAPDTGSDPALKPAKPSSGIVVTDLGLAGAKADSRAEDIDDQGRIVGSRGLWSGPNRAFLWTPTTPRGSTGVAVDLGDLGGGAAEAWAMNQSGQVVGSSTAVAAAVHAFLWEGGTMHELPAPGPATHVIALDVNDAATRLVVGGDQRLECALLWTVAGTGAGFQASTAVTLPGLSTLGSFAFAVNNAGTVVGYSNTPGAFANQPAKWTNTAAGWIVAVLPLPGTAVGGVARDINASGTIVGEVALAGTACTQAVAWEPAASVLPGLTASSCTAAAAVNDAGQISGVSSDGRGSYHAVLWQPLLAGGYAIRDLGGLSGGTPEIRAMNEPGAGGLADVELVGFNQFRGGALHATLWTVK